MKNDENLEFKEQEKMFYSLLGDEMKMEYFISNFINKVISSLKRIRKQLKITQHSLAKKMGIKQSYISKLENYEKTPTLTMVAKYLFALGFSLDDIPSLLDERLKIVTIEAQNVNFKEDDVFWPKDTKQNYKAKEHSLAVFSI